MNHLELDEEELLVLDLVCARENEGGKADLGTIRALLGVRTGGTVAQSLRDSGHLVETKHNVPRYNLTQNGKKAIRAYRRRQAREDLLEWLYGFARGDAADTAGFNGPGDLAPYTPDETQAAADFLVGERLAGTQGRTAGGDHFAVWITERGRECSEAPGTLAEVLARKSQTMGNSQHITIDGSGNTITAAAGDDNTLTVTVDNFDIGKVREIVAAVRQSLEVLHLPAAADELIVTIQQSEERGALQRAARELYQLLAATSTGTLGGILAQQLGQTLGIS